MYISSYFLSVIWIYEIFGYQMSIELNEIESFCCYLTKFLWNYEANLIRELKQYQSTTRVDILVFLKSIPKYVKPSPFK